MAEKEPAALQRVQREVIEKPAVAGDWTLVRARVLGRTSRNSDVFALQTPSGQTFHAKVDDFDGVLPGPPPVDWERVSMGRQVVIPRQGTGRFITRAEKEGSWMVLVLLDGETEPGWYFESRVQLA